MTPYTITGVNRLLRAITFAAFLAALTACWGDASEAQSVPLAQAQPNDSPHAKVQRIESDGLDLLLEVQPATVRVAEPVLVTLTVNAPLGTSVSLPDLSDTLDAWNAETRGTVQDLPVGTDTGTDTDTGNDAASRRLWRTSVQIESLTSGQIELPSISIDFRLPSSAEQAPAQTIRTEPMTIDVASVVPSGADPTEFFDIRGEASVPPTERRPTHRLWIAAVVCLAVASLVALYAWQRGRARRTDPLAKSRQEISRVETLYDSGQLSQSDAWFSLMEVLRRHLQAESGFPATAQSSEEVLQSTRDHFVNAAQSLDTSLKEELLEPMAKMLHQADEYRFSGGTLSASPQPPFDAMRRLVETISKRSPQRGREKR